MDNPSAFPIARTDDAQPGMTLLDYFAAHTPLPSECEVELAQNLDRSANPHNDPHKPRLRGRFEIIAAIRYRHAEAMLVERAKRMEGGR